MGRKNGWNYSHFSLFGRGCVLGASSCLTLTVLSANLRRRVRALLPNECPMKAIWPPWLVRKALLSLNGDFGSEPRLLNFQSQTASMRQLHESRYNFRYYRQGLTNSLLSDMFPFKFGTKTNTEATSCQSHKEEPLFVAC